MTAKFSGPLPAFSYSGQLELCVVPFDLEGG